MYCLNLHGRKVNRVSKQVTLILGRRISIGTVGGEKYTVTLRNDTKNACRSKIYRKERCRTHNCFLSVGITSPPDACVVFVCILYVLQSVICA
jgi:hypothetical protein